MTTQAYRSASRRLLAQARAELAMGDLVQASEKGWGAAAQMVKAVAQQRGWDHDGHGLLYHAARRLRNETGDQDIIRFFAVAGSLHTNFYEDWLDAESVAEMLDSVERFVELVEPLAA